MFLSFLSKWTRNRSSSKKLAKRNRAYNRRRQRFFSQFIRLEERTMFAAFTPGDLLVYRVGDGAAGLVDTGNSVYLDEFNVSAGNARLVQSIKIDPQSSVNLIASSSGFSEGLLSSIVDANGRLAFTGYNTAVGGVADLPNSSTGTIGRSVGIVGPSGTVTLSPVSDLANNAQPTAAVLNGSGGIYLAGTDGKMRYSTLTDNALTSATTTQINTGSGTQSAINALAISSGQLFATSSSGSTRLGSIGTGTPTTAGQVTTALPGFSASTNVYEFAFFDLDSGVAGNDTLYVVDRDLGIAKYSLVGGTWTLNGIIGSSSVTQLTGLAASKSGGTVSLFASGPTGIVSYADTTGYNGALTNQFVTTLALKDLDGTTGYNVTNFALRGLEFVPDESTVGAIGSIATPVDYVIGVSSPVAIASTATFTDQSNFQGAALAVSISNAGAGDALDIAAGNGITVLGTNIFYNSSAIGSVTVGTPGTSSSLTITFSSIGNAASSAVSSTAVQALLRQLTFKTTGNGGSRTVGLTLTQADGKQTTASQTVRTNTTPTIAAQSFSVNENLSNGIAVGTVVASAVDSGQSLIYSITGGNSTNAFAINATNGAITVADATKLNYETVAGNKFDLTVQVTDNGLPVLSASNIVTVNLLDVNESPTALVISGATVAENQAVGTVVGSFTSTDPDTNNTFTYSLVAGTGSTDNASFTISGNQLLTAGSFNFESKTSYSVRVQTSDQSNATFATTFVISVTNVNEAPVLNSQTFSIAENSVSGTSAGTVLASDPDSGQTLTYAAVSGSGLSLFQVSASGQITLKSGASLDYETTNSYQLSVRATDNGSPNLSTTTLMTINVTNVNESPILTTQSFAIAENSANSTGVGTVVATDPESAALTYSITAGNTSTAFSINSSSGAISVSNVAALNFETTPRFTLTVQASDGTNSVTTPVTISLSNVNEAPTFNQASYTFSLPENSANNSTVGTPNGSDVDAGDSISYSIFSGNSLNAFSINAITGAITVADSTKLNFETNPSFALVVRATDTSAAFDTRTVTINLTNANEAPTVSAGSVSLAEGTANGTAVTSVSATDPDTVDTLTYAITGGNTLSAFAIQSSTGAITVASAAALDFETTQTFALVVRATDAGGLSSSNTISITLTDVNDAPIASAQSFNLAENSVGSAVVGTVIARDPDVGQSVSYAITGGSGQSRFSINATSGQITVQNSAVLDFEVTPSLVLLVNVTDDSPAQLVTSVPVTINLSNVNEAPAINNQTLSVVENSAANTSVGSVSATDPDAGQVLSYSIIGGSGASLFSISSAGAVTVKTSNTLNFESINSYTLVVNATDSGSPSQSNSATVTVSITNVNEGPAINAQSFTVNENSSNGSNVGVVLAVPDTSRAIATYTITAGNAGAFAINTTSGSITVADATKLDFETVVGNRFVLTVQATDDGTPAVSKSAAVTINLADVNEAPSFNAAPFTFSINENSSSGGSVGTTAATDADAGSSIAYSIIGGSGQSFFDVGSGGQITVKAGAGLDYETTSSYTLVVRATDNGSLLTNTTATINLNNVNEAPALSARSFSVNENSAAGTVAGSVTAIDSDVGQTLSYSITGGTGQSLFTINATGQISVASGAALNFESTPSYSLFVRAADNGSPVQATTATMTMNIANVNEPPTITANQLFNINENSSAASIVGTVAAADPDANSSLAYSIVGGTGASLFGINPVSGQVTVANGAVLDFEGQSSYTLSVLVTDNLGATTLSDVTVALVNVHEAPIVSAASFDLSENSINGAVVGQLAAVADTGRTIASYQITGGNTGNAFAINATTGVISVADKTKLNYETVVDHQFLLTVVVTDSAPPLSTTRTITVNLADVSEAPTIPASQVLSVPENSLSGTVVGNVSATDEDADNVLSYEITSGDDDGIFFIDPDTGSVSVQFDDVLDFESKKIYPLTITVSDGNLSTVGTVTISLTDVNEAPSFAAQTLNVVENSAQNAAVGTVRATDVDAGQTLSYTVVGGTGRGLFNMTTSGVVTVGANPQLNFEGVSSYTLVVQVRDSAAQPLSGTTTVTVNVTNVNEKPVFDTILSLNIPELSVAATSVGTVSATDPENQSIGYSIVGGTGSSLFIINAATGAVAVASGAVLNFESTASYTLIVRAIDNDATPLLSTTTVTINLSDVNESPVIANQTFTVSENSLAAESVGKVVATDPDVGQTATLAFSVLGGSGNGLFNLNSSTGIVSVASGVQLNYEGIRSYTLRIAATDKGASPLQTLATVTINLTDVNEAPVIGNSSFSIPENSSSSIVVGTVTSTDEDAGDKATYALTGGTGRSLFTIDSATGRINPASGAVLNYESIQTYTLEISATDSKRLVGKKLVNVEITNVNEAPNILAQSLTVDENLQSAGKVTALEPDSGQQPVYSMLTGADSDKFSITTDGQLSLKTGSFNYELIRKYKVVVQVQDAINATLNKSATVTVNVTNLNEPPVFSAIQNLFVFENSPLDSKVGLIQATDPDNGDRIASWAITGGTGLGLFKIDPATGTLLTASTALNYEQTRLYTLIVEARDTSGSAITGRSAATVTISIGDINEPPTIVVTNPQGAALSLLSIPENTPANTVVAKVLTTDPDTGEIGLTNLTLSDTLQGALKSISTGSTSTGVHTWDIVVADVRKLNFEALYNVISTARFKLNLIASDGTKAKAVTKLTITSEITDVNEAPVDLTYTRTRPPGSLGILVGSYLGMITATDPDTKAFGVVERFTYSLVSGEGSTDNASFILAATGELKAGSQLPRNRSYSIRVSVADRLGLTFEKVLLVVT